MRAGAAFLAAIGLALACPAAADEPVTPATAPARLLLPSGTLIELVTRDAISTRKNVKGDLIYLKVAAPVIVDGATAIPADTVVVAQLTRAEKRGAFGRSGKLDVQLLYAELPGGPLRVSGTIEARGKKDAGDTAATAAAFLALPFVATGRSAEIPAGAEVSGRLDRDVWIGRR
ncbi:Putative secreted protein [Sphingopyxis fribergensis]|uniref:Putative secreted protein n=1 Tax=Sphingopyxis fribergensis TaxID=1515612 RepID=A0A0A7PF87_9SPHN|nr:hypothetical protein [Sphingopyxis fribergensis]AJA07903.1 Putative secreted protein [Sphingopyxis fribergensis]